MYDKSHRLKPKLWLHKMNVTAEMINGFDSLATKIKDRLRSDTLDTDMLAVEINESFYNLCRNCRIPE